MSITKIVSSDAYYEDCRKHVLPRTELTYKTTDERVSELIDLANTIPGLTVADTSLERPPAIFDPTRSAEFYITFLCNAKGMDALALIYNHWFSNVLNTMLFSCLAPLCFLKMRLRMIHPSYPKPGYVWYLSIKLHDQQEEEAVLKCLKEAVEYVIAHPEGEPV